MSEIIVSRPALRRRRRGMTLVEVALSMGVVALILVGLSQLLVGASETMKARSVADRIRLVTNASQEYVKSNFAALFDHATIQADGALAVPIDGAPINADLPSLVGGGFLPSSFINSNAYQQTHALIVRKVAGTDHDRLEAIVTTTGGTPIDDRLLGQIGGFIGADGGFMFNTPIAGTENRITGLAGGWSTPAATWVAGTVRPDVGHVMTSLALNEGTLVGDYLHRIDIGIEEANRMRTNFRMGSNDIVEARAITSGEANGNVTVGPNLVVTEDATVTDDLGVGGNANVGLAGVVGTGEVKARKFFDLDNELFVVDPASNSTLNDLTATTVTATTMAGSARITSGAIGAPVLAGTLANRLPNYVAKAGYLVSNDGNLVAKPTDCGEDGTEKITFMPITDGMRFAGLTTYDSGFQPVQGQNIPDLLNNEIEIGRQWRVVSNGLTWSVFPRGTNQASVTGLPGGWQGLAMTYCYYPPTP